MVRGCRGSRFEKWGCRSISDDVQRVEPGLESVAEIAAMPDHAAEARLIREVRTIDPAILVRCERRRVCSSLRLLVCRYGLRRPGPSNGREFRENGLGRGGPIRRGRTDG